MSHLPEYYVVFDRPVKIVAVDGGGSAVLKFNFENGKFENGRECLKEIMRNRDEVDNLTEDEFIQIVEAARGRKLKGEGTLYDLYAVINGIEDMALGEGRALTTEERATVIGLRRKTYKMFELSSDE